MKLSAKLFIERREDYILGPGRVDLLRAVAELGSLRKAAQKYGMSYRWAWGRINDAEKALGVTLLSHTGHGKAKSLTPQAEELLSWFAKVEADVNSALATGELTCPEFLK